MASIRNIGLDAPVYVCFIIPENAGAVDSALFVTTTSRKVRRPDRWV